MLYISRKSNKKCLPLSLSLEKFSPRALPKDTLYISDLLEPVFWQIISYCVLQALGQLNSAFCCTPVDHRPRCAGKQRIRASTAVPAPLLSTWLRIKLSLQEWRNSHCKKGTLTSGTVVMLPLPRAVAGRAVPTSRGWKRTAGICLWDIFGLNLTSIC